MVKIIYTIAFILLLTNCNNNKKGEINSSSDKGNYINYYNAFIDVNDKVSSITKKHLEWIYEDYPEYKKGNKSKRLPLSLFVGTAEKSRDIIKKGLNIETDKKDFINKNMTDYLTNFEQIFKKREEFEVYTKAEDFKTDNWKKGDEIVKDIEIYCNKINEIKTNIFPTMEDLAEKAELEFLENDPDKDYIITLKQSIKTLDIAFNKIELLTEEKANINVDSLYNSIENEYNKMTKLDETKISNESRKVSFISYKKQYENTLAVTRKIKNEVLNSKSKIISKRLLNDFNSEYTTQINRYNSFIN